jgi:hypothetical protein
VSPLPSRDHAAKEDPLAEIARRVSQCAPGPGASRPTTNSSTPQLSTEPHRRTTRKILSVRPCPALRPLLRQSRSGVARRSAPELDDSRSCRRRGSRRSLRADESSRLRTDVRRSRRSVVHSGRRALDLRDARGHTGSGSDRRTSRRWLVPRALCTRRAEVRVRVGSPRGCSERRGQPVATRGMERCGPSPDSRRSCPAAPFRAADPQEVR